MRDCAPTLAAIATIPRRAKLLDQTLRSLRGQVDELRVYLNGFEAVPGSVREYADEWIVDPENNGAEKKLHWSEQHDGIYLSCDDDFIYPRDYAATMVEAVRRWSGRAIVSCHGRVYSGAPGHVDHVETGSVGIVHRNVSAGRWVNHCGSGVMAWDARVVRIPSIFPESNIVDMQIAVWAQENRVPMWLVPHRSQWLHPMDITDPRGIFASSKRERHMRRNELLRRRSMAGGWHLHEVGA